VNPLRFALTAAAAALATAAVVPAAQAATTSVSFDVAQDFSATVELTSALAHTRFEVTRNGAVRGSSTGTQLSLGGLSTGDQVTLYNGTTAVATVVYDGLPSIADTACVGYSTYGARRAANTTIIDAGAYDANGDELASFWTTDVNAVISLKRPLEATDVTYVRTVTTSDGETTVTSERRRWARKCDEPQDGTTTTPPPPPPPTQTVAPPELTPSAGQLAQAVKGSLSATGASLRERTTRRLARLNAVALPFAFPEPGHVELQLVANKRVIGSGTKTSTVNGKVILTVQLTTAGRKLLKRSKKLKVTVKGAFTPARNGGTTSRASSTVTLRR
jgi:hypothetical protein